MDKYLYLAMQGASQSMQAQQVNAHNLANASTVGFKATIDHFEAKPVYGPGYAARVYTGDQVSGTDFNSGSLMSTGRDLDVAIHGDGWFVVQADDGGLAYSRRGDLHIDANGLLLDGANRIVLGESGPVTLPQFESLLIGRDGSLSVRASGQGANSLVLVDRLRLVNPSNATLYRGEDGLFRSRDGAIETADAAVTISTGTLESSNVNTIDAMVKMMAYARHYETQVKMMNLASENDESSASLMRMNG